MRPPARATRAGRRGQGVVEYGLIAAGSGLVTLVTIVFLGPVLADFIALVTRLIDAASGG